jgi:hypothetical protein
MSNVQKTCPTCHAIYIGDGYKNSCTRHCHFKSKYNEQYKLKTKKKMVYDHVCKKCKSFFKSNKKASLYCSFGCISRSGKKSNEEKIKEANEKWLLDKPRKKPKYSIKDVNKMMEWKRVWDDNSWSQSFNMYRG